MTRRQRVILIALLVLVIVTVVGLVLTSGPIVAPGGRSSFRRDPLVRLVITAQDQFDAARKLAESASTREEKRTAREALRIADNQVDLAFATALQEAADNPTPLSPAAQAISDRLKNAQAQVDRDRAEIERLKKHLAGAKTGAKDGVQQQIQLLEAQADLDQDEVDDAHRDLSRAGGDPQDVLQRMKQRYEAQEQANGGLQNLVPSGPQDSAEQIQSRNIIALASVWRSSHGKLGQLQQAEEGALAQVAELKSSQKKDQLAQQAAPAPKPAADRPAAGRSAPARPVGASPAGASAPGTAERALLKKRAAQRKNLEVMDKRIEDETQLADTYQKWAAFVRERQRQCVHLLLVCLLWILAIAFVTMIVDMWVSRSLARLAADRRQVHTLHSVAGYAIRGVGAILILLVIFGPPTQFAAVLALAGAALTVALKDFIVAFLGWFVLMGRNGIRAGDWVEINGVSGEVLEIGPLRTILLETGDGSDAGHPTGRQVAFMNGYAVEGNYFNFSTSGQWVSDEIQFAAPADSDPFAAAEAVKQLVAAETQGNAQLAADEWKKVAPRAASEALSSEPVVSVRPAGAGATLVVRYITRANERLEVRSRIYRGLFDLQRGKDAPKTDPRSETP